MDRIRRDRTIEDLPLDLLRTDGTPISILASITGRFDDTGELIGTQGYIVDDTQRRNLERQLFQAQKMDSLGTLAGGIAHDFNNILGILFAHLSLLPLTLGQPERFTAAIEAMSKASERGASLVRQLLSFARLNEPARELIRASEVIDELAGLLRETFPRVITFERVSDGTLPVIHADPTQMHQILLNLCVNARDAMMPGGGSIQIHTKTWSALELMARLPEARGGDYAEISVTDTGSGISEEVLARIFDPFYSTKPKGRGTGLGLSTVYGIVKSHNGFVDVESTLGKGTTFHIFLPAAPLSGLNKKIERPKVEVKRGSETLLLVDDEESLREALRQILENRGYKVITAADGEEAIGLFTKHADAIQLVITDYGLPRRSGYDVVEQIKRKNPNVKVVIVTGFLDSDQRAGLADLKVDAILMKPVRPDQIARRVREIFDNHQ